jgi:hypothetical protein
MVEQYLHSSVHHHGVVLNKAEGQLHFYDHHKLVPSYETRIPFRLFK